MKIKQRIIFYLVVTFLISLVIITINRYYQESKIDLVIPDNYFTKQNDITEKMIDTEYPNLKILKDTPHFSSNEYFDYRITTKSIEPPHLNIYLTPLFSDKNQTDNNYQQTKSEILNWIVSKGTAISNLEIDFYLDQNNQKTIIESINQ